MDPNGREQTELLRLIWNEMKALGQSLGGRIDQTNERLDTMRVELKDEIAETNARLGTVEQHLRDLAASSSCWAAT